MKGYKIFEKAPDNKLRCRNYLFDEANINELKVDIELCKNGFHFCTDLNDCFKYYEIENVKDFIICSIEADGTITERKNDCTKMASSKIKIIKRLSDLEIVQLLSEPHKVNYINFKSLPSKESLLYVINNIDIDYLNSYYKGRLSKGMVEALLPKLTINHNNLNGAIYFSNSIHKHKIEHLLRPHPLLNYNRNIKDILYGNILNGKDVLDMFNVYLDNNLIINHIDKLSNLDIKRLLKLIMNENKIKASCFEILPYIITQTNDIHILLDIYGLIHDIKNELFNEFDMLMCKIKQTINSTDTDLSSLDYECLSSIAFYNNNKNAIYYLLLKYYDKLYLNNMLFCLDYIDELHVNELLSKTNNKSLINLLIPKISILSNSLLEILPKIPDYKNICQNLITNDMIDANFDYSSFIKIVPEFLHTVSNKLNNCDIIKIINEHNLDTNIVKMLLSKINYDDNITINVDSEAMKYIDELVDISNISIEYNGKINSLIEVIQNTNKHFNSIMEIIIKNYKWTYRENVLKEAISIVTDKHKLKTIKQMLYELQPVYYYIIFKEFSIELCDKISFRSEASYFLNHINNQQHIDIASNHLKSKFFNI